MVTTTLPCTSLKQGDGACIDKGVSCASVALDLVCIWCKMSQCKRQARRVVSVLNNQVSSEVREGKKTVFHKCVYIETYPQRGKACAECNAGEPLLDSRKDVSL